MLLDELKRMSKTRYVSPFDLAVIYGAIGDKDLALEYVGPSLSGTLTFTQRAEPESCLRQSARLVQLVELSAQN